MNDYELLTFCLQQFSIIEKKEYENKKLIENHQEEILKIKNALRSIFNIILSSLIITIGLYLFNFYMNLGGIIFLAGSMFFVVSLCNLVIRKKLGINRKNKKLYKEKMLEINRLIIITQNDCHLEIQRLYGNLNTAVYNRIPNHYLNAKAINKLIHYLKFGYASIIGEALTLYEQEQRDIHKINALNRAATAQEDVARSIREQTRANQTMYDEAMRNRK